MEWARTTNWRKSYAVRHERDSAFEGGRQGSKSRVLRGRSRVSGSWRRLIVEMDLVWGAEGSLEGRCLSDIRRHGRRENMGTYNEQVRSGMFAMHMVASEADAAANLGW